MNTAVRAFLLFTILLVLALLLGQAGAAPVPVSLQIGAVNLATSAPVAITLGVLTLLVAFYLGRFTGWLVHLPRVWQRHKRQAVPESIADAYAAYAMGNTTLALQRIEALKPDISAHADLIDILALHAPLPPKVLEKNLANPRLAALTALTFARLAARQQDWAEVKRLTALGRQHAPENAPLVVLQFKALLNLNDPAAAELLPLLKSLLGPQRHKLLTQVVQGPTSLTARPTLDSRWVKSFQAWLPTASDTFPDETAA